MSDVDFGQFFKGVKEIFEGDTCEKCGVDGPPRLVFKCTCEKTVSYCLVCKRPEIILAAIKRHLSECTPAQNRLVTELDNEDDLDES